jgi:Mg-chelatase subunit ChlI
MSDGPHRCLSMRKPWKDAAHAADSSAFSEEEIEDRVSQAIRNDWAKEVPASFMTALRECFGAEDQMSMIPPTMEAAGALRHLAPGSAFVAMLADCAEDAAARGLSGEAAIQDIARAALEDRAERSLRHIQEIYQRESSDGRARRVVGRVSSPLGRAISKLAQDVVQSAAPVRASPLVRFTGIDEGPRL